ncbi:MAG: alpha/beta hydrolase family protein [Pyrinomonadaceae bacterium]
MAMQLKNLNKLFCLGLLFMSGHVTEICGQDKAANRWISDEKPVGVRYYSWADQSRLDKHYGSRSLREVNVQIWYPIKKSRSINREPASYIPNSEKVLGQINSLSEDNARILANIPTASYLNAVPLFKGSSLPVVVFSPALGGHTSFYTYLAARLASAGYVVVGVDHKYDSLFIVDEKGRVVPRDTSFHDRLKLLKIPEEITADEYRERRGERIRVLGEDLIFVLDRLKGVNASIFKNRLDLGRVGLWGHSTGGAAAIDAAKLDARFAAVVNLDGTPSGWAIREGLRRPFMQVEDLRDLSRPGNQVQFDMRQEFCAKTTADCYRILLANANHNSYLDTNIHQATNDDQRRSLKRIIDLTSFFMVDFFDRYIRGRAQKIHNEYPKEVTLLADLGVNSSK